ncbi:hypothetical protein BsWGS_15328 [Bradybaena similaris]
MAEVEKLYMQSPLVRWVETFKANDGHPLEYKDLYEGVFLNDVMQQIDPRLAYDKVNRSVEDATARLHNWDILVNNIQGYYRDVLQQLLVLRLPNIGLICREPGKDCSFLEVRKALLLILGCAVQCEQKEEFIDKIMTLDITAQTEIVENIKEVTDDCRTILPIQRPQSPTSSSFYIDKIIQHLYRLIRERDECAELAVDAGQERDFYMSQTEGRQAIDSPQKSPGKHHLALELAECKAKLRHVRQELEDKQEQLSDVKDELQESISECSDLRSKNAALIQESRVTRTLRDELDILKEKAMKVDVYEKEVLKYKEKLNELEFYKARTEELKEDNSILEETKAMLEDQLSSSRKRIETVVELESKLERYRQQIEELTLEQESDRKKLEYLTEENARLEFEKKSSLNESASLETELSVAMSRMNNVGSSLSEQLTETSHTRILRLELENQRLAAKLAEMKEAALIQSAEVSLELEKENQRLAKKVEKLQSSSCEASSQLVHVESELSAAREEKERLLQTVESLREKSEQQVEALEKENEQLSQALHQIRERIEKTSDLKVKDLEKENRRLLETVTTKNSQLNKLEFDNRQLQRSCHQLQENIRRVQELEHETQSLEKENADLHQKVATLHHAADKLEAVEQESSDLSVENHRLQKTVESLQKLAQRREQEEQDHISLKLEHQRLQRTLETLKSETDRAVELESEKNDLTKEIQQLQKLLEGQKTQKLKHEQMEVEVLNLTNENQRLRKSMELLTRQLQQLDKDNVDLETEREKLNAELETLRVTTKHLQEKDTETSQLEGELLRLQKDKSSLEKENKKLKQSLDLKGSSLEEVNARVLSLGQELKSQKLAVEKMKETCSRVKDLEKENKQLLQELNTDRRTLATLREDLVNEKIRSQELSNELEQLTSDLENVGVDTAKLTMVEQTKDANRYKALETMIEETLQKSSEIKDKKILSLESRLEESKNRNMKLQEDLRTAKRESEILKQRHEEESAEKVVFDSKTEGKDRDGKYVPSIATKEIFQLKDHLVELERKNATLLSETDNLRSNNQHISEQCRKLETQLNNLHSQNAVLQSHYSNLQEQNAKLQVEYSTLQSQTNSSLSQQDMLKNQLSRLETDHENLTHKYEGLQNTHQAFVSDHESLQHLHHQLTSEYESLMAEYGSLKSLHKSLKVELKDLQEQLDVLLQGKDDVNKLRDAMEKERDQLKRQLSSLGNLQTDHQRLRESHHQLKSAYDKLSKDYSDVLASHKQVKTDYNTLQLKTTELQGELSEAKENLSVADMEFQKLENRMEAVYQINERIDNENQALLMQIKQLLNQNHELLIQALNSKDHFAEEEKAYLEKLSELRRQKERLEEKIMEHYKNRISPKKKGIGALIARKARGIMSRGPKRSKSRNNLSDMTDSSSQGFGSPEQTIDRNHVLGARSTEDINRSTNADGEFLPGLGRPYNFDDCQDSGDLQASMAGHGRRIPSQTSQDSEMITLKQFLREVNSAAGNSDDSATDEKSRGFGHPQIGSDNDSRKSDHSTTSSDHLRQQLQPHQQNIRNSAGRLRQDATVGGSSLSSPTTRELSTSKTSHNSTESGSEGSYFGSDGVLPGDYFTSTPKIDSKSLHSNAAGRVPSSRLSGGSAERPKLPDSVSQVMTDNHVSGNDMGKIRQSHSSASISRWVNTTQQPPLSRNVQPHIPPALIIQPRPSQQQQHPSSRLSHPPANHYNSRDPPTDPPPAVPFIEGGDRPSTSSSQRDRTSGHYAQPFAHLPGDSYHADYHRANGHRNPGGGNDSRDPKGAPGTRLERRRSQGSFDTASKFSSSQSQPALFQPVQGVPSSTYPQNADSSIVSGNVPHRPQPQAVSGQIPPRPRVRPASVMGQSPLIRGIYSRPHGEIKPRQQQQNETAGQKDRTEMSSGVPVHEQAEVINFRSQPSRLHLTERSKSVPPHLFNKTDDSDDDEERSDVTGLHKNRPVRRDLFRNAPGGQNHRESQPLSGISLIQEPSRSRSSSRTEGHSQEPQGYRQTHLQQATPPSHQQIPPSGGSHLPVNSRQPGTGPPAQTAASSHESPSSLQTQSSQYHPAARAGLQVSAPGQHSSPRPDFLPLTRHEVHVNTAEHAHNRQNYDSRTLPQSRSQSSLGNMIGSIPSSLSSGPPLGRSTSTSSSTLSPGASYGRSSAPGFHPAGRRELPPHHQHGRSNQDTGTSHYDVARHDVGQHVNSSDRPASVYSVDRLPRGDSEPRVHSSPYPDALSPTHQQPLTTSSSFHHPSSSKPPPPPPPRTSSRGPSQFCRSDSPPRSDVISGQHPMTSQQHALPQQQHPQPQQQQTVAPPTRSQGRLSGSYQPHPSEPQPHTQDNISELPSPRSQPAPDMPQPKTSPLVPERSEKEADPEQTKAANSVWYEYGCV